MKKIFTCLVAALWAASAFLARPAGAADGSATQPLRKISIAYSAISPNQAPAWMAYEAGLFRKYGLDAQLIFVEGGSRTVQTLVSGDVIAAQVAGSSVIQSNLQGSGIVLIAGFLNTMDYKFIVARDITRPDQLKGKTVAVSRIGASSDFATRYALDKYGLVPDKDVAILQIGSQPARFSALEAGRIQGVMIAIPLTAKATKMGFNTLADLQMLGLEYQHTALAVNQNLLKTQPDLVRNVLKAFVEGIHYMKTNRQEALAVLAKYLKTDDQDALVEAYEAVGVALVPEKPYPTIKGIQIMLRELGAKNPAAQAANPEQFVDTTLLKELDQSGFIDGLYKSPAVVKTAPRTEPAVAKATPRSEPAVAAVTPRSEPVPAPLPAAKPEPAVQPAVRAEAAEETAKPVAGQLASLPERDRAQPTQPVAKVSRTPVTEAQQYIVRPGDTLSRLADRFYNAVSKWERIYEANRDTVRNPNYIFVGQKLIIPADDPV